MLKSSLPLMISPKAAQEAEGHKIKLMREGEPVEAKKPRSPTGSNHLLRKSNQKPSAQKPKPDESKDQALEVYSRRPISANSNFTMASGIPSNLEKDLGVTADDLIFKKYV